MNIKDLRKPMLDASTETLAAYNCFNPALDLDAAVAIRMAEVRIRLAKQYLDDAVDLIRAAEKEERIQKQPVKAYCCQVNGFDDCYIPAKTHSKARWRIVSGLRDIGYKESGNFHMVRVIRAPQYDEWAKTAKPVPISFEGLMAELGEK